MSLAMAGGQLVMSASVHQIPALASFGVSRTTAGLVILGVSIVGMVARIVSGYLGDYLDKRRIIAVAFVCQLIGTLIFAYIGTTLHLLGFILFWGVGFGGSIPVRFAMIADYFGRRSFGSIMGTMMTVSTVFGVIGPVFVGGMFDLRGNYREPYLILSLAVLVSIPLILTLPRPAPLRARA
jgi:MFS family permease